MNKFKMRLLAATALALTAGLFAQPLMAQQSADPGSRPGDVPGTQQQAPAPNKAAPLASPGPGTHTGTGSQLGDVPGTQQPTPAPAARSAGNSNPVYGGGGGAQLGDVPGTQQPTGVPGSAEAPSSSPNQRSVAIPTECAGQPTEQARLVCMQRSSTEQGKPGGQ